MKKILLSSFFTLSIVSFTLAQQAPLNAKQQKLRALALKKQEIQINFDLKKKELLNKSSNFIIVGSDQQATDAAELKTKKKASK